MSSEQYNWPIWDGYRELDASWSISKAETVETEAMKFVQALQCTIGHILDLWCGQWPPTNRLSAMFPAAKIDALDGSIGQITAAQEMFSSNDKITWYCNDIRQLPEYIQQTKYDLVTAFLSLHYLSYDEVCAVLCQIHKMLAAAAWLVMTINNPLQPVWGDEKLRAKSFFASPDHADIHGKDQLVFVDLYDAFWNRVTTLEGVHHHSRAYREAAFTQAWFSEVKIPFTYDSLAVVVAKK